MTYAWKNIFLATVVLNSYAASSFGNTTDTAADGGGSLASLIVSMILVLGAAAAATLFLRRWRGSVGRREGPLRLEHVIALGPRERLALVKVGQRYLVIGVTPTSINKVAELSEVLDESLDAVAGQRHTTQDDDSPPLPPQP